jgi:aspartyl-tRNA(Asn)/glutamyl-tRNA(Gln) amidotransferase subunit C
MKITEKEVIYVANLARLEIDQNSIDVFARQIGSILEHIDVLNQIDTTGVDPTTHAIGLTNVFREDIETTLIDRDAVLLNAPEKDDGQFLVPKIVG